MKCSRTYVEEVAGHERVRKSLGTDHDGNDVVEYNNMRREVISALGR